MTDNTCNGWKNRETWLVSVWFAPETKADLEYIRDSLEEDLSELPNGCLRDMICLSDVNWRELEEALDPEMDEEEGGDDE